MRTIGLLGIFHDASVVLCEDDRIVYGIEEERLSRLKYQLVFPYRALEHVLETQRLRLSDIDRIGFFWDPGIDLRWMWQTSKRDLMKMPLATLSLMATKYGGELYLREAMKIQLGVFAKQRGEKVPKLEFLPHHLCHAAHAYATSPFERAAVLVCDAVGGEASTTLYKAENGKIERITSIDLPHSLGEIYSAVTVHLGFKHTADEWKVMGLAPYGEANAELDAFFADVIVLEPEGRYSINRKYTEFHKNPFGFGEMLSRATFERLGPKRDPEAPLTAHHRAIARALQRRLEQAVFHVLRDLHRRTGLDDLCYAGGVSLNCVANGKIRSETPFKRVHVPFAPGDEGTTIGAALLATGRPLRPNTCATPYLGPGYTDEEIEKELVRSRLTFTRPPDIAVAAAKKLAAGDIVGWFQGRLEMGPRSLGNRSILADPRRAEMKDRINGAVKFREGFRPFAPAVLAERAAEYFDDFAPSPYMSFALKVRSKDIPAVTHEDGTGRLQTVERDANPQFHALLEAFGRETGVPVLLNTSFNIKGEPIVCSPYDALRCFFTTGLDHLAIGPFLLSKSPNGS